MPDKAPNTDYIVKPTLKGSDITDAGKKFDKNTAATAARYDLTEAEILIQEIDKDLDKSQGSFKKKIWDLSKMESLVHSDPKLEAIYQDMEREAEENQRYGYHWNEAVLNIMFNDYVLNSPKYLQKYKMAIPSEKKRRDKSGIKDLQRKGEKEMEKQGVDVEKVRKSKTPEDVPEGEIHNNSLEGVIEEQYKLMENWAGDMSDEPNRQPVDQSNQSDYLQRRIEKKYDTMNEHHLETREEKEEFIYKHKPSMVMGQIKSMSDEQIDNIYNQIEQELGMVDEPQVAEPTPEEPMDMDGPLDESIVKESGDMIAAKMEKDEEEDINETTGTVGQGGASNSGAFTTKLGLDADYGKKKKKKKGIDSSFWVGGEMVESNYLTEPLLMESIYEQIAEDEEKMKGEDPCWSGYEMVGSKEKNGKEVPNCVPKNESTESDSLTPLSEEKKDGHAVSQDQQQAAGAAYAAKKGDSNPDDLFGSSKEMYDSMTKDELKDKASTKHKGLPEKVDEVNPLVGIAVGGAARGAGEAIGNRVADKIGLGEDHLKGKDERIAFIAKGEKILNPQMKDDEIVDLKNWLMGSTDEEVNTQYEWVEAELREKGIDPHTIDIEESMEVGNSDDPTSMAEIMKNVNTSSVGGASTGGGGMFEGEEITEDVSRRTKCKRDEEPVKGVPINQPGGCKKKDKIRASAEEKQKNPYNIKSRQERIKRQEKEMENKEKEQSKELKDSKKELAEQKELFESILNEDKKPASLVNVERLGKENQKNFTKDKKDSTLSDVVDTQDELSAMAQIEEVGENPYELGEKIEAQKIKDNKMESFENEGDSTNDDNKHIPKRNLTSAEDEEISLMRNGMHSLVYDNKVPERFEERMERDMGDEIYELRQKQMEYKEGMPRYNKEEQPIDDTKVDTKQYNKYKDQYISQIGESVVTGKYRNHFNRNEYINFKLNEVKQISKIDESYSKLSLDGLGNRYTKNIQINESVEGLIKTTKFYIKEGIVYGVVEKQVINESQNKEKNFTNEGVDKFKKLSGYSPSKYVDTKHARNIIK